MPRYLTKALEYCPYVAFGCFFIWLTVCVAVSPCRSMSLRTFTPILIGVLLDIRAERDQSNQQDTTTNPTTAIIAPDRYS